jgi:predicted nucleic-acid-binding protein
VHAVDTNVVVRYLVADDLGQSRRARAVIERQPVWVSKTVLQESAWVLDAVYDFSKQKILEAFEALLGLDTVHAEDERVVADALRISRAGIELADALHVASAAASCDAFLTFDRKLAKTHHSVKPVRLVA